MMRALVQVIFWIILPNPNMIMPEALGPCECFSPLNLPEVLRLSTGLQYAPCPGHS